MNFFNGGPIMKVKIYGDPFIVYNVLLIAGKIPIRGNLHNTYIIIIVNGIQHC